MGIAKIYMNWYKSSNLTRPAYKATPNGGIHVFARLGKALGIPSQRTIHPCSGTAVCTHRSQNMNKISPMLR